MRKKIVLLAASAALASLVLWSIRGVGDWYPMHDSTHLARILLMRETWMNGQIPALWASHINHGLGYPLFHFYAPLFHTLSAIFLGVLASPTTALKLSLWVAAFVGSYGVMLLTRRWGRLAALVSAFAFALSPYMAVSLYVRGSYSEYLSLALLPWVFLATEKIKSGRGVVLASLALTLFVLSHNLIPIVALPMILLWMVYHNYRLPQYIVYTILLTLGLSSWFVVPLIMERGFTIADQIARTTSYQLHFVEPWQLWNSTWGFGGSALGVEDGMSFKLGKIQIIFGLLGMATALYKKNRQLSLISLFLLVSFWLTTASSRFLWDASSTLQIVQFPWRTLGLLAFYLSILTGYLVSQIGSQQARRGFAVVSVVALLFLNLKYFTPQSIVASPLDNPNIDLTQIEDISTVVPEFMPVWLTKSNLNIIGSTVLPYAYYPTWEVELDGRPAMTYPSASGQLAFNNPANSSNYLVRQSHTRLENISLLVSLLALIIAIKFYVKK